MDKRSDIWAFGCVLYEMLTGRRAFAGEDVSDVLAAVLARGARLDVAASECLARARSLPESVPAQRPRSNASVTSRSHRLALEGAFETAASRVAQPVAVAQPLWRRPLPLQVPLRWSQFSSLALLPGACGLRLSRQR